MGSWPALAVSGARAIGLVLALGVASCSNPTPPPTAEKVTGILVKADELCRPCQGGACQAGMQCISLDSKAEHPLVCAQPCGTDADCADLFPGRTARCTAVATGADALLHPVPVQAGATDAFLPCQGGECVCLTDAGWCPHRCIAGKWESCNSLGLEDEDGCEQDLSLPQYCGHCDQVTDCTTMFEHATGQCKNGATCTFSADDCDAGWADCDGLAHNGCETDLRGDEHCGACGNACGPRDNAQTVCGKDMQCVYATQVVDQVVGIACDGDWADCQTRKECEGILSVEALKACLERIQPAVDGAAAGCETPLGTLANCGGCGKGCKTSPSQPALCESGKCLPSDCQAGWGRCGALCVPLGQDDRCTSCTDDCTVGGAGDLPGKCCVQVMTPADPNAPPTAENCVTLEAAMKDAGDDAWAQEQALNSLTCNSFACKPGWANCDGSADGSCETNLTSNVEKCGTCQTNCAAQAAGIKHAVSAQCEAGKCKFGCEDTYTTCSSDNICVTKLGTNAHCKACGDKCKNGTVCIQNACQCPEDKVACTKAGVTTCQKPGVDFCEVCGDKCLASDACSLVEGQFQCKACEGVSAYCIAGQGCVPINTPDRCGNCDNNCYSGAPQHVEAAEDGKPKVSCTLSSGQYGCNYTCQAGYADCDTQVAGCESPTTAWPHCGACNACAPITGIEDAAKVCQTGGGQAPCAAYAKAPSNPEIKTVTIEDKTVKVTWSSKCKYGYFDCNDGTGAALDGCECRTQLSWSTPPAWLLDCSQACAGGQCSCDYAMIEAMVCEDAKNKCL